MMRRNSYCGKMAFALLCAMVCMLSCVRLGKENPYEGQLCNVTVKLQYPEGHSSSEREGVNVVFEEINRLISFNAVTSEQACAELELPRGLYRISASDSRGTSIYNGTLDKVRVSEDRDITLELSFSQSGTLVFKEIYCGGCTMDPATGNYRSDKYVILHNNSQDVEYLDGLCFGTLAPYNSNANNPWGGIMDFAPVIQAVWKFPGEGEDFPLQSGEDAILCLCGAIDHTAKYHLSVNLNRPDCFICYNELYFPNPTYHPVPGDKTSKERYMIVVEKLGQANAYTFSINSPTAIIFRPKDITIEDYIRLQDTVIQIPGSSSDRVVCIPWEWILDGVEVFNGSTNTNNKRIRSDVDAGYVTLSETFKGRSLMRREDEKASAESGYTVLMDTNNSSADFYERQTASLHE